MLSLTLRLIIAGAAVPLMAAAQVPPVPPTAPSPPTRPAPMVQQPLLPPMPMIDFSEHKLLEQQAEFMKFDAQNMRFQMQELAHIDVERMKEQAAEMRFRAQEFASIDAERFKLQLEASKMQLETSQHALMELPRAFESLNSAFPHADKLLTGRPRKAWASEDPADSLYRAAREALNRGEYRRAAQLFNEVTKKFPRSQYALDCAYWEAFSRYRAGGTDDLRQALRILDEGRVQLASLRSEGNVDVQALRARVQGALAARGDQKAAEDLKREMTQTGGCDREEISVRAEALGALGQMDITSAMPVVKKVLARRDECTVELRRRALYLLGRQSGEEAATLILDVAKNDTDANIRAEAMRWLPKVAGDNAVPQLEELLKTSTDEQTQRSAISALGSIDTDRARRAVRAIIERNDAVERVRYEAIMNLSREREGRVASADDMNYLRSLYGKVESQKLREAVLTSLSRIETPENEQFLLAIARNQNESPSLRATALQRLGRMQSVSATDIAKLYDVADARSLREQILYALSQRKEPEAIDKMMEVARKDTDPNIRRTAISLLARSNNERAKQLLKELIDK